MLGLSNEVPGSCPISFQRDLTAPSSKPPVIRTNRYVVITRTVPACSQNSWKNREIAQVDSIMPKPRR